MKAILIKQRSQHYPPHLVDSRRPYQLQELQQGDTRKIRSVIRRHFGGVQPTDSNVATDTKLSDTKLPDKLSNDTKLPNNTKLPDTLSTSVFLPKQSADPLISSVNVDGNTVDYRPLLTKGCVGSHSFDVIIDTGANASAIDHAFAQKCGLRVDASRSVLNGSR